jgi:hypothetical protein
MKGARASTRIIRCKKVLDEAAAPPSILPMKDLLDQDAHTTDPVSASSVTPHTSVVPEFVRLPKPGFLCPHTGLSRSALNELILPTPRNGGKPPVKSYCLRQKGAKTGIRLINFGSLISHIRQYEVAAGEAVSEGQEMAA